ncbi:MAG: ComF family protein [bacterium]
MHTVRSIPLGMDEWGREHFETTRTEIGEALYRLKYRNDRTQVEPLAEAIAGFIRKQKPLSDLAAIIPVPRSDIAQSFRPVELVANAVGKMTNLPVPKNYLTKTKKTTPLKNIDERIRRRTELKDAFKVADSRFADSHVLILDDLFRSGETLRAIASMLKSAKAAGKISVLTATATRSKR